MNTLEQLANLKKAVAAEIDAYSLELIFKINASNAMAFNIYADDITEEDLIDYLRMLVPLENGLYDDKGGIRGLFQFSKIAWQEAGTGDWETNSVDPVYSGRAALKYYFINRERYLRRFAGNYTKEIAYLYHNQGPTGAAQFINTGVLRFPNQSRAAIELFNSIRD